MFEYRLCDFATPLAAIRRERASGLVEYGVAVDAEVRVATRELLAALMTLDGLKAQDFSTPTRELLTRFEAEGSLCGELDTFMQMFERKSIFRQGGPLWSVRNDVTLLLSDQVQHALQQVSRVRRYIWRRVEHLSKLAKPTAEFPTGILTEALDINELVTRAIALESARHSLDFRFCNVQFEPGVIPTFCGDGIRLLLGVREILRNAVFATRIVIARDRREPVRNGSRVTLKTAMINPQRFCITIEDNGIGLPPDAIPMIRAFGYSALQGEVTFGGLGIGIPTAIASFEELGGEVVYDSNTERGTHVTLVVPLPE